VTAFFFVGSDRGDISPTAPNWVSPWVDLVVTLHIRPAVCNEQVVTPRAVSKKRKPWVRRGCKRRAQDDVDHRIRELSLPGSEIRLPRTRRSHSRLCRAMAPVRNFEHVDRAASLIGRRIPPDGDPAELTFLEQNEYNRRCWHPPPSGQGPAKADFPGHNRIAGFSGGPPAK